LPLSSFTRSVPPSSFILLPSSFRRGGSAAPCAPLGRSASALRPRRRRVAPCSKDATPPQKKNVVTAARCSGAAFVTTYRFQDEACGDRRAASSGQWCHHASLRTIVTAIKWQNPRTDVMRTARAGAWAEAANAAAAAAPTTLFRRWQSSPTRGISDGATSSSQRTLRRLRPDNSGTRCTSREVAGFGRQRMLACRAKKQRRAATSHKRLRAFPPSPPARRLLAGYGALRLSVADQIIKRVARRSRG
jgi:hypothetical protein